MSIANDNSIVVRTDTYGAYIRNGPSWQQLVTANSMPAAFVGPTLSAYGVYEIAIAPSDSNFIYMYLNGYIFRSTNKATTWTQTNFSQVTVNTTDPYRYWGQKIAIDPNNPNNVYVGTPQNGLYYSTDGINFTQVNTGSVPIATGDGEGSCPTIGPGPCYPGFTGIVVNPNNSSEIFASSYGNGIYHTTGGPTGTWTNITSGSGPTTVVTAAYDANANVYYALDNSNGAGTGSLWKYASGTWTNILSSSGTTNGMTGMAIDPNTANHVITLGVTGPLNETFNAGSTWGGWSNSGTQATYSFSDVSWLINLGEYGFQASQMYFDRSVTGKLYQAAQNDFLTTTVSGSITGSTNVTWAGAGAGIEQLVGNLVLATGSDKLLAEGWDHNSFLKTKSTLNTYPTTSYPFADGNINACWGGDYAAGTPNFIAVLCDGFYVGNMIYFYGTSSDGGNTWTAFPTLIPSAPSYNENGIAAGTVAVSTPSNIIWAPANRNTPYYTKDGGNTWSAISISGVTWSSAGDGFAADIQSVCADRVNPNTFYFLITNTTGGTQQSTDGGTTWTQIDSTTQSNPASIICTPGKANDVWIYFAESVSGPPGNSLQHLTYNGSWLSTTIANVDAGVLGLGAAAYGHSYPAIYFYGWLRPTIPASTTLQTGVQTFTLASTGITWLNGSNVTLYVYPANVSETGTVVSSDPVAGTVTLNITSVNGSGSYSNLQVQSYGLWRSVDEASTWQELVQYPNGSLDQVKSITADPAIYGRVYFSFGGSGYAYGQYNFLLNRDLDPTSNDNTPVGLAETG